MGFFDEIKSSVNEIFSEFSEPVQWRNRIVNCIVSQGQDGVDLESGGFVPNGNFSVKFDESELAGEIPQVGDIVVIRDCEWRINWVSNRRNRGQIETSLVQRDR